ncbi:MAG: hypothetical protein IKG36_00515 [Mycoplasmataceae bacterium]|nr:hypothetical protein [Mycoplasmataceae bacterium]
MSSSNSLNNFFQLPFLLRYLKSKRYLSIVLLFNNQLSKSIIFSLFSQKYFQIDL